MRIVDTIARWVEYPRAPASSMGGGRARRPDVRRCRLDRASKQYEVAKAEHDAVEREKAEAAKPRVPAFFSAASLRPPSASWSQPVHQRRDLRAVLRPVRHHHRQREGKARRRNRRRHRAG